VIDSELVRARMSADPDYELPQGRRDSTINHSRQLCRTQQSVTLIAKGSTVAGVHSLRTAQRNSC
jgi:hypothetical protein